MNKFSSGWVAAIFVGILWGFPSFFGKFVLQVTSPNFLVWIQYTLGFLTLGILILIQSIKNKFLKKISIEISLPQGKDLISMALGGIVGQGVFSYFSFLSLDYIPISDNGVIQGLIPIFILVLGSFFYGEKFSKTQILAIFFTFMGASLLVMDPIVKTSGFNRGHLICFLSAISFASCVHERARLGKKYGSVLTMFYQFFFASLGFLFILIFSQENFSTIIEIFKQTKILFMILILGVGISGLSYLLYIFAMNKVGVGKTGIALNLIPVSSFLLGVFILGESITSTRIFALGIVFISLCFFMETSKKNTPIKSRKSLQLKQKFT